MNKTYLVFGRKYWKDRCRPIIQVTGSEERAVDEGNRVYNKDRLNRVIILDKDMRIIFKAERLCSCKNCQQEFDAEFRRIVLKCMDCKVVHEQKEVMV